MACEHATHCFKRYSMYKLLFGEKVVYANPTVCAIPQAMVEGNFVFKATDFVCLISQSGILGVVLNRW